MKIGFFFAILVMAGALPLHSVDMPDRVNVLDSAIFEPGSDWLLLVYMAGDNNLGRDGYEWGNAVKMDLEEMENSMPDTGLRIFALADMEGANNTYLYDLEPAPPRGITSPTIPLSEVNPAWDDEVDMSDWTTLRDFLEYSLNNHSAKHVMFVLWDHGAGWYSSSSSTSGSRSEIPSKGFALDSNSGGAMFLDEFRDAFAAVNSSLQGIHMDIIGFDTCSMGMMEVFYQVSQWFDLAIGSEDEQPWYGYNYTFVSNMGGPVPYDPVQLGHHIVQEFEELYIYPGEYPYATISLVNLTLLRSNLITSLDLLSGHLFERMYQNEIVGNHGFGAVRGRTEMLGFENLDLGNLLMNLAESDLQREIRENASKALAEYDRTVLDQWHQPDGRNIKATGISIYLPPEGSYRTDYDGVTGFLDLTAHTGWDEMIREFHGPIERVHIDLGVAALDGDGIKDDVTIQVTDPRSSSPISGARVTMNGSYLTDTDPDGIAVADDLYPGSYRFEVFNGSNVGEASIRVLNRAPVAIVLPMDPVVFEGDFLVLDAGESYDLDGDPFTYRWDLDDRDGLNGSDSNAARVNISFPLKGTYTIRLTVNDTELQSSVDVNILVVNAPPLAKIEVPAVVKEDQVFQVSASKSWDSPSDLPDLLYMFLLDGYPIANWTNESEISLSIGASGEYLIKVRVMDQEGATANASAKVHVNNLAPVANITGPSMVNEDEEFILSGEASTDTPSDMGSLSFEWYLDLSDQIISESMDLTLSFAEQGFHTVELLVIDDDGDWGFASLTVDVRNLKPVARIASPKWDLITWEDTPLTLWGNATEDSPSDMSRLNYSWDIDGDLGPDLFGPSVDVSWPQSGKYAVSLRVTDDNGESDLAYVEVTVRNRPPEPELTGPAEGYEDEYMVYRISPDPDTPSDLPSLIYAWYVDGRYAGSSTDNFTFQSASKGTFIINLSITDDDNEVGETEVELVIRNPKPHAVLDNVPTEIVEGESFTALGFRSTDNPSDMDSLLFQWFLDDEEIEGATERNLTLTAGKPGSHTLKLCVTDDDLDRTEVEVTFLVKERNILTALLDRTFSTIALLILIGFLLLILVAALQFVKRTRELPPICATEEGSEDNGEKDETTTEIERDDQEKHSGEHPDEQENEDDMEELPDIPIPDEISAPVKFPPIPDIAEAEIPEVDGSMFSDL